MKNRPFWITIETLAQCPCSSIFQWEYAQVFTQHLCILFVCFVFWIVIKRNSNGLSPWFPHSLALDGYHRFSWEPRNRDGVITRHSSCILQAWHHKWNHGRHGQFLDAENAKFLVPNGGFPPCCFLLPRDGSSHFCGFIMFHPIHHGFWGMFKTRGKLFHYCWLLLVIPCYTPVSTIIGLVSPVNKPD